MDTARGGANRLAIALALLGAGVVVGLIAFGAILWRVLAMSRSTSESPKPDEPLIKTTAKELVTPLELLPYLEPAPALTARDAVDGFKNAVKNREYNLAADVYLQGEYHKRMKQGATAANRLGVAIDGLLEEMNSKGLDSDKVKVLLTFLEPFPRELLAGDIKKGSDTESTFVLNEDKAVFIKGEATWQPTTFDTTIFRALSGPPPTTIAGKVKLVGNKDKAWRLDVGPLPRELPAKIDRLNTRYKVYVLVLEKVKAEVRNTSMTTADFEGKFKQELERAAQD